MFVYRCPSQAAYIPNNLHQEVDLVNESNWNCKSDGDISPPSTVEITLVVITIETWQIFTPIFSSVHSMSLLWDNVIEQDKKSCLDSLLCPTNQWPTCCCLAYWTCAPCWSEWEIITSTGVCCQRWGFISCCHYEELRTSFLLADTRLQRRGGFQVYDGAKV